MANKGGVKTEGMSDMAVARALRARVFELQKEIERLGKEKAWTIANLRDNCPHEDTTVEHHGILGKRCNTCGKFNSGGGWNA